MGNWSIRREVRGNTRIRAAKSSHAELRPRAPEARPPSTGRRARPRLRSRVQVSAPSVQPPWLCLGGRASLVLDATFDAPLATYPKRGRTIWNGNPQGDGDAAQDSTRGAIGWPASSLHGEAAWR